MVVPSEQNSSAVSIASLPGITPDLDEHCIMRSFLVKGKLYWQSYRRLKPTWSHDRLEREKHPKFRFEIINPEDAGWRSAMTTTMEISARHWCARAAAPMTSKTEKCSLGKWQPAA
ncbi:hypothetical protein AM571_PC01565 (plasmid) [Rhizobium etli 8C-3]|uniref:Uncharacterized protein n=1 Tax=Rhizobium etli 8C-3 TaxID=538025 RepID=A0A1L5PH68_RHIET|nr:hypothetical protein AM571_PC01565 [Rhizobium etli 8C-3]